MSSRRKVHEGRMGRREEGGKEGEGGGRQGGRKEGGAELKKGYN